MKKSICRAIGILLLLGSTVWSDEKKHADVFTDQNISDYIEYCSELPWEGEFQKKPLGQYKCYPRWINCLPITPEEVPVTFDRSPLHFFISKTVLLNSSQWSREQYDSFYQYCDQPETFQQFLLNRISDIHTEEKYFQYMKKDILLRWCIGEVSSENYYAIICISQYHDNPHPTLEYMPHSFYKKDGRYYLKMDIEEDPKLGDFMLNVSYSLHTPGECLHKIFIPPNPKYPSIPRWHCWCNKKRTKAVLAELIKWDEEMVLLRKYEDGKLLKINRLQLCQEDQELILCLEGWTE